ncbi:sulfotransferase family protein (plasmid) [Octadecabacter sp. SW4]|uniref:sulfotransferase family 2 domain-containing protein n=1 Tax=Octadecabacter sp. SW4 TaxID=2602067 RepID=UPI0011C209FE|nr:sulfotransferase family 2 domain-containing protein [Octadecabacter sp. SW4]QEE37555.1 sulfotransferase family protein [Octadecabacter sp. SW4]
MANTSVQATSIKATSEIAIPEPNKISQRLFVVDGFPIRYLVIPKCGCTYVKNVLWRLQHGQSHDAPIRVHDDDERFARASDLNLTPVDIAHEEHAFTVVRKPIDRFLSLYFDKVVGPGRKNYVPLAATLEAKRGLIGTPQGAEEHRKNIAILIDWLGDNLSDEVDLPKEAHWTPQMYRKNILEKCDLKLLLVEDLTVHLRVLLSGIVPGIEDLLGTSERNESPKKAQKNSILTPKLRNRINEIYAGDKKLYQRTRNAWKAIDLDNADAASVPRYRSIIT